MRNFVFNDSEFLGGSNKDFLLKRELLNRIITDLPPIKYKIYCRADTLEKFNDYQTLKKSGLVSVFIGVESLYQSDLDALNKDLNVNTTINAIRNLRKHKIYSDLSFIFFNHNTNTQSIRDNLDKIEMLLNESAGRYMGMPYFSFSFESGWSESEYMNNWISKKTYLKYDVLMKTPAAKGACFDTNLEPLMEVYRLLAYEWSKKVIFLNQVRSNCDKDSQILIEVWFQKLAMFCVKTMKYFLDEFVQGHLQLTNLPSSKLRLYEKIQDYYLILPEKMRQLETFDVHANKIDYQDTSGLVENDEYWTQQIPWRNAFDFHSQEELNKILEN
ncbi:hypothetical protein A3F66_01705 [candidate division TM6 bacterium RIFCSPHIGHO2_12_FULL_32_22]|nr:MAG: hypothetical protein A3F66_01705 [candidate division TM6 bacterium RIFCSPHIGHO2_12_FULL_32_22]